MADSYKSEYAARKDLMQRYLIAVERLAAYEDTGLEPEEIRAALEGATREFMVYDELGQIGHLRELVQAEKDGRLRVLPKSEDKTCGSCGHFKRTPGKRSGVCEVRTHYTDCRGHIDTHRGTFTPSQSRKCCRKYIPKEGEECAKRNEHETYPV